MTKPKEKTCGELQAEIEDGKKKIRQFENREKMLSLIHILRAMGPKLHHGKQSLKQLKAHGAALTNIEVTEANIGVFKPCAKKYGVDFTLRKDKTTQPPHYIVIFKAKDADNLEQAFREFTAKTLSKEQRPSIRKVLAAAKQKAAQQPKRAKEKIKQRGLER